MFALLAVICFAVDFVLNLVGTSSGKFDLIALGLALLAAHFVVPAVAPYVRRDRA